jgi:hypothetical protein
VTCVAYFETCQYQPPYERPGLELFELDPGFASVSTQLVRNFLISPSFLRRHLCRHLTSCLMKVERHDWCIAGAHIRGKICQLFQWVGLRSRHRQSMTWIIHTITNVICSSLPLSAETCGKRIYLWIVLLKTLYQSLLSEAIISLRYVSVLRSDNEGNRSKSGYVPRRPRSNYVYICTVLTSTQGIHVTNCISLYI